MRLPVVLIGVGALTVACSGSGNSDSPKIKAVTGNGDVGITSDSVTAGVSLVQPMRPLCTTGKPVQIANVTAMKPTGGMHVTSWGTRYFGPELAVPVERGGVTGRADQIAGFGHHAVTVKCGDRSTGPHADLAMQFDVSFTAMSARGTMQGVIVHYGNGQTTTAQYAVAMCTTKNCESAS